MIDFKPNVKIIIVEYLINVVFSVSITFKFLLFVGWRYQIDELILCQNLLLFVEQNLRQSICLKYSVYHKKIMRRTRRIDSTINLMSSSWVILLLPVWNTWYSWFIFDVFLHLAMSRGNQKIEYRIVAHLNLYWFLLKIEFKIKAFVVECCVR